MKYTCPVCGYDELRYPPSDYTICPSCGTEFGNTDFEYTWEELRKMWIERNCEWHSRVISRPQNWNPLKQLENVLNPLYTYTDTHYADIVMETDTLVSIGKFTVDARSGFLVGNSFFASKPNYVTATIRE